MSKDEQEYMQYCEALTQRHSAQYLTFLIAYPMAIAIPNPDYQEDF